MSLKFAFKNINRVASSNVKRQIVPIYSSRVFVIVNVFDLSKSRLTTC